MLIDKIENCRLYSGLSRNIFSALEYIVKTDFTNMETGKYEIDGENMFALVSDYTTKNSADCHLEAHRKYIDVQYMVKGNEMVGYALLAHQTPVTDYDEEKDVSFFKDDAVSFLNFNEGLFAIFFPGDLHMPGTGTKSTPVRKVVVKVKI